MRLNGRQIAPIALFALASCVMAGTVSAQGGLVQPGASAQPVAEPSAWSSFIGWIYAQQRAFHTELIDGLRALSRDGGTAAAWTLVSASFLYGVFHAAGPGHGKAILTTYLMTHREQMRRGVLLAALSAFCQGLVAVGLVYGLILLAGWLPKEAKEAVNWSERASFALLTAMGGYLAYRAVRSALRRRHFIHHHHHGHDHDGCCGHAHAPSSEQVASATSFRTTIGVILSIGLRPCTGAVLVLVFAQISGLLWTGVAAVAAMSAGTAIAVASLAFAAVNARSLASRLATQRGGSWVLSGGDIVALSGGAILALIGYSLLAASFGPQHPLGL